MVLSSPRCLATTLTSSGAEIYLSVRLATVKLSTLPNFSSQLLLAINLILRKSSLNINQSIKQKNGKDGRYRLKIRQFGGKMVRLKCNCCGFEQEFEDNEAAYRAGWDAPPHFTGYVACHICPAVCVIALSGDPNFKNTTHIHAHDHWKEHGRPEEFNQHCLPDDQWGKNETQFKETVEVAEKKANELVNEIFGDDKSKSKTN
jgi:hypothetical protein